MAAALEILDQLDRRSHASMPERLGMILYTVLDAIYESERRQAVATVVLTDGLGEQRKRWLRLILDQAMTEAH
jgi:hypothetical protein